MDKNPLLGYLMNPDKEDVLHTSGYVKGSNGGNIGSASAESFHQRIEVDENRNYVGQYKDSKVMRESRNTLPRSVEYSQREGQRNFAHSDAYADTSGTNNKVGRSVGDGNYEGRNESGYNAGSVGGRFGGMNNNGVRKGFTRSEIPGLQERQAMIDRFSPSNLAGRSEGRGQAPARRNPGISR